MLRYREGLINRYGIKYVEFIEGLKKCPVLSLSKKDLMIIHDKAKEVRNALKNGEFATFDGRISARNIVNDILGIYPEEFSAFVE
jgi:hypothetical protein